MGEGIRVSHLVAQPAEGEVLANMIQGINDLYLVAIAGYDSEGISQVIEARPQVVVVGLSGNPDEAWGACLNLTANYPEVAVIKIVDRLGDDIYRQALRAGVRELLVAPPTKEKLADATYQVVANRPEQLVRPGGPPPEPKKGGKVVAVFSTKGGVGKTTVATNVAVLLAKSGKKTALLDLDLAAGNVALALDVVPRRSMAELADEVNRLDIDLLESYLVRHKSGVMVLAAPFNPDYAEFIAPDHVEKALELLSREYDYVVVDSPNYLNDVIATALHKANAILLVGNLEIFSIKNLKTTLPALESLGVKEKVRLVINKASQNYGIKAKDVENTLGTAVWHSLPSEESVVVTSINQGNPLVLSQPNSGLAKSFRALVDQVLESHPSSRKATS